MSQRIENVAVLNNIMRFIVVKMKCPNCSRLLLVPPNSYGKKAKCSSCGKRFIIPAPPISDQSPKPQAQHFYENLLCNAFKQVAGQRNSIHLPPIPDEKLANAKQYAFCPLGEETPIVLIDYTVSGSAKKGVLFTDKTCYYHTDFGRGSFRYEHIVGLENTSGFLTCELTVFLISGNTHTLPFPDKQTRTATEHFATTVGDHNKGLSNRTQNVKDNVSREYSFSTENLCAHLRKEFTGLCQDTEGVYIGDVPQEILDAIKKNFPAQLQEEEQPLVLAELLAPSKSYILFTNRACYHRSRQASGWFAYSEVQKFYTDTSKGLKSLSVLTSDGMVHPLRFLSDDAFHASESVFSMLTKGNLPTQLVDEEERKQLECELSKVDKQLAHAETLSHTGKWFLYKILIPISIGLLLVLTKTELGFIIGVFLIFGTFISPILFPEWTNLPNAHRQNVNRLRFKRKKLRKRLGKAPMDDLTTKDNPD